MVIGVPREISPGENRVALSPDAAAKLVKSGIQVQIETGAGKGAFFADDSYKTGGAQIDPDAASLYKGSDIVAKVARLTPEEIAFVKPETVIIAFFSPLGDPEYV